MSQDFLEVLNVRCMASKQISSIFGVAILLLPVLKPFHAYSRSILEITWKNEVGAGERDSARTVIFHLRFFPLQAQ